MALVGEALILGLKRMEQLSFTEELFSELLYPFAEYVLSNWKINQCRWAGQQSKAHQVYMRAGKVRHTLVSSANNQAWGNPIETVSVVIFPCNTNILLESPAQGWAWAEFQMWCILPRLFFSLHSPINHNLSSFSQALFFFFLANNGAGGASELHREMFCVIKHKKYKYFLPLCFIL